MPVASNNPFAIGPITPGPISPVQINFPPGTPMIQCPKCGYWYAMTMLGSPVSQCMHCGYQVALPTTMPTLRADWHDAHSNTHLEGRTV